MRLFLKGVLLALVVLSPWTVMAQRFDVVTFAPPPGWSQQPLGEGLMFEFRPMRATLSCQMFLRKSWKASAALPQELDRAWAEIRDRQQAVADAPDPAPLDLPGGLKLTQRVGRIQTPSGLLIAMLNLFQKDDRLVSVVVTMPVSEARDGCGGGIGDFLASLRVDATAAAPQPLTPKPNPALAAKFGNSVVGTWRYAFGTAIVTLNAPTQSHNAVDIRFARDGTYRITVNASMTGGARYNQAESGTYQVEGQRILMRPQQSGGKPAPYALDWFFGDNPNHKGNWGLILRAANPEWLGSFGGTAPDWRTFRPPE